MARKNNRKSRRRASTKPTERFFWSNIERLKLLAYLDWCVQSCVKFETTAPGYLENATGRHFSKERIRRKLYQEWHIYGACNKFNDLFELGTAGLKPLVGEEQELFYQIVADMSPAWGARCTRSRSLGLTARSGTFSAPRSNCSISRSREPNEVFTPQAGNSNVIPERPRQKIKARSSLGPTRQSSNNDLSEDVLAREDDNTETVKSEGDSELSTTTSRELSDIELQPAPVIPDSQEDAMTVISQAQSNSSMETRLRQSEADLLKQKSHSVTLEERISELKRRNDDLEHCIRLASSAEGKNEKEAQLREEISSLKDKLHRKRLLEESHDDLEADRLGFLNTSLHAEYEILHANIRDISSGVCNLSLLDDIPEQRTGFSRLANNWAKRIGWRGGRDRNLGSLLSHCEAAQIPKKVVLASLIAAGIFELVLEDVFPTFLAADSPLLDQYRRHIETENRSIKDDIIEEKSKWLSSDPETAAIKGMEAILTHALEVKIELLLCVKRMKYLFFKPGTLFDGNKMEVVESQAGDSALPGQKVQICLFPALFAVSEATDETEVEEETSLSATYSKALTEVSDKETESLVLLEKAIVFL
ncbi:hypothetical protein FPRO05_04333 [Fusarium proliferatum]|uniref:Uncharacterized protein n=1 Tax=Gibberella intermedia TaxID=948311 RepID=A0A365MRI5_GIBIN|nr:hypothetical protein FPRO05_04333 [Fusarium proliferatum]